MNLAVAGRVRVRRREREPNRGTADQDNRKDLLISCRASAPVRFRATSAIAEPLRPPKEHIDEEPRSPGAVPNRRRHVAHPDPCAERRPHRGASLNGDAGAYSAATLVGVMFMGSTLLTPLYALYRREFGFSIIVLTLLYSVYVVGNLCALLFLGGLSDQIGRRKVALGAIAVAGVSTLMFLFANNPAWLFLARVISGLSIGVAAGTGTAWLAELIGGEHRTRASTIATAANFLGVAAGPILSGLLAQYAPWPTRLSFIAYLVVVALTAILMARTAETVQAKPGKPNLRPRIGVPADLRVRFIPPAVSVFGVMALVGFYAALIPSILSQELHQSNLAVGGAVAAANVPDRGHRDRGDLQTAAAHRDAVGSGPDAAGRGPSRFGSVGAVDAVAADRRLGPGGSRRARLVAAACR